MLTLAKELSNSNKIAFVKNAMPPHKYNPKIVM
jgi:hypothetical protein